jgi:hypothetical protein
MRSLKLAVAALAVGCWAGAAFAVVDETKDVPVTNQGSSIPEGHITIETTSGKPISSGKIVNGRAHLHIVDRRPSASRDEKVVTRIHDNKTGKTYTESDRPLGAVLDFGIDAATGGAAGLLAGGFTTMPANHWFMLGVGVPFIQNHATGDFFGPGTGSGVLLTNDRWSEAVQFTGGIFVPMAPSWSAGLVVNVLTPSFNNPSVSGITSTGIPVTAKFQQSGVGVEALGRAAYLWQLGNGTSVTLFGEAGGSAARYKASIDAPMVTDFFDASRTILAPVVGAGISVCPWAQVNGLCNGPELFVEFKETFLDQSFLTGVTPASSGLASFQYMTSITAGISESFYDFYSLPVPGAPR